MNGQNLPAEAKSVFAPEKGHAFVQGDFSNLELRVAAYAFEDDVLQRMFAEGKNIHDENTRAMFGIDESHPNWKYIRRAAKIFVFGRLYGGGVGGIYERINAQVPEVALTMAQFRAADKKFFDAHPALAVGMKAASQKAVDTRVCVTATGRKRFFLGTPEEIEREGINTPIQGAAGDIANESLIDMYEVCKRTLDWKLVSMVHDSIVVECPVADIDACARALKSIMEKPRKLWNREVVFPADIECSTSSLGEMKPYEIKTDQAKAARKPKGKTA
jgi:DNA polymerase I